MHAMGGPSLFKRGEQVERSVRTLRSLFDDFHSEHPQRPWVSMLDDVAVAYNTHYHTGGCSVPFEVFYGRPYVRSTRDSFSRIESELHRQGETLPCIRICVMCVFRQSGTQPNECWMVHRHTFTGSWTPKALRPPARTSWHKHRSMRRDTRDAHELHICCYDWHAIRSHARDRCDSAHIGFRRVHR